MIAMRKNRKEKNPDEITIRILICRRCKYAMIRRYGQSQPRCSKCRYTKFIEQIITINLKDDTKPVQPQLQPQTKPQADDELLNNISEIFTEVFMQTASISAVEARAEQLFEKYSRELSNLGINSVEELVLRCFKI